MCRSGGSDDSQTDEAAVTGIVVAAGIAVAVVVVVIIFRCLKCKEEKAKNKNNKYGMSDHGDETAPKLATLARVALQNDTPRDHTMSEDDFLTNCAIELPTLDDTPGDEAGAEAEDNQDQNDLEAMYDVHVEGTSTGGSPILDTTQGGKAKMILNKT